MSCKIRVLDEHTINKIAAGEVIENPASVVKELVENAIDAQASAITIEIQAGGRQLIRISDNGYGMNQDDAVLCLERHATSKIKEVEDIHTLLTMGFRGEAVPSIASISKFTILTRLHEEEMGTMVLVDGGRLMQVCPAACAPGTTIEVKSLFFNIPVRKKFQKSPNYDTNEILKMVSLLALAHPDVHFHLISNEKTLLETSLSEKKDVLETLGSRVEQVLGIEYSAGTVPVSIIKEDFQLAGYFGQPTFTRPNKTGQYLFINRRGIQSPFLSYAVRESYGTSLSPNRYPIFVLHLTIPGDLVDVNVHPQKKEVRLRQEEILKNLIQQAVQQVLEKNGYSSMTSWEPPSFSAEFSPSPFAVPNFNFPKNEKFHLPDWDIPMREEVIAPAMIQPTPPSLFNEPSTSKNLKPPPKIIGTLPGYILIDPPEEEHKQDGFYIIHQRQAHCRIIFDKLEKSQGSQLQLQTLLIPYHLTLNHLEISALNDHHSLLQEVGLHFIQTGPSQFSLEAFPQVLGNLDLEAFVKDLLIQWRDYPDGQTLKNIFVKQIALTASRAAISSSQKLSFDEAQSLVKQLWSCAQSAYCPLGNPIMVHLSLTEIQKKFQKL